MSQVQHKVILSALAIVVAGVAACGKPSERNKIVAEPTKPVVASPSADATKAADENKKAAAAQAAAEAAKAAEIEAARKSGGSGEQVSQLEDELKKIQEARSVGATEAKASAAEAVEIFRKAGEAAAAGDAANSAKDVDAATPSGSNAATASGVKVFELEKVTITVASNVRKIAFIKALIQPSFIANAAVFRKRASIEKMQAKLVGSKNQLSERETDELTAVKSEYGDGSFSDLLARVDGVNLSYLIAPLAVQSNWDISKIDLKTEIGARTKTLNTSNDDESVRFRSARLISNQTKAAGDSAALFKESHQGNARIKELVYAAEEVNRLQKDPAIIAEVDRIKAVADEEAEALR